MLSKVLSYALSGVDGFPVTVETFVSAGLFSYDTVGLPDTAVKESRERVRSAIKNSGFEMPNNRITVNLAPADLKKEGSVYDLPIAVSLLAASGQLFSPMLNNTVFIGELSLSGEIRPVTGVMPMIISALKDGFHRAVIPAGNAAEVRCIEGIECYCPQDLYQLVRFLQGEEAEARGMRIVGKHIRAIRGSHRFFPDKGAACRQARHGNCRRRQP